MEISSLFLYVTQPDDTIDIIAKRFNTSAEDIIRFNPSLQFKEPHSGQPLNIKTNNENFRAKNIIKKESIDFNITNALIKIAFYIKEAIISSIVCPKNLNSIQQFLDELYQSTLINHYQVKTAEELIKYKAKLRETSNQIIEFTDVVGTKHIEDIKSFKCRQDDLIMSVKYLTENDTNSTILDNFKSILELWNLYTLKFISERYEEAQLIFMKIIDEYEEFSTLL